VQTHLHRVTEPATRDVDIALSLGYPKPPASRPRPGRRADRKSEDLSVFAHDAYDAELIYLDHFPDCFTEWWLQSVLKVTILHKDNVIIKGGQMESRLLIFGLT